MGEFVMKDMAVRSGHTVLGINCESEDAADFRIDSAATSTEEIGMPVQGGNLLRTESEYPEMTSAYRITMRTRSRRASMNITI